MATRTRKGGRTAYIANESFVIKLGADKDGNGGIDTTFHQNRTRAYEGDEVVERAPHLFDMLEDYDENQAYD